MRIASFVFASTTGASKGGVSRTGGKTGNKNPVVPNKAAVTKTGNK